MNEFKCNRCEKEFNSYDSLRRHVSRIHKINSHDFFVEFKLNGKYPLCKCGCNERTKWDAGLSNFCDYKQGHQSRVKNNWGHNENAIKKSAMTRRNQYASGERKVWNDGLTINNPDVFNNIQNLINKSKSPEERKRKSEYQSEYLKTHAYKLKSKLEKYFKTNFLKKLNIKYDEKQFYAKSIKAYYDIKITEKNILIEVDGDFFHCNPIKWPHPVYDLQIKNVERDKVKNEWAKSNGYKLIRFWENDINNNPAQVMKTLLESLEIQSLNTD